MGENEFPVSSKNRVRQGSARGKYDHKSVFEILDQDLVGHLAFIVDGEPMAIPMLYARDDDVLLFHGSTKSRLMNGLTSGIPLCFSVVMTDGLVLARSLFHHSMNYRSATVFGSGYEITDESERLRALRIITDKVMPERWNDSRQPSVQEMKATCVAGLRIETASVKSRAGGPVDDAKDMELNVWAGVVPIRTVADPAITAEDLHADLPVPSYVRTWSERFNGESST